MRNEVELWISGHLEIPLAIVMDPGSNMNSILIVILQKRVRKRGKD